MPRPEKVQAVAEIKERLESAQAVFLAEYSGLSVKEQQELRRGLRASEAQFKIVKMTLARRAADELGHDELDALLTGPTGLAFADGDAAAAAKVLSDFAAEHARLVIKGGLLAGELLSPERVSELAELEPRDVLLARLAGAFQAPLAAMASLLAAMPRNLATMVQQVIDKLPDEAPAADEAAEMPAAATDEAPAADEAAEMPAAATDEVPAADEAAEESAEESATDDASTGEAEATAEATADDATDENDEPADEAEEE
jgi:large subunit ribosomal protein L10